MKRIFLLCTILSVAILQSSAQGYSDFWSVKAGVNFANFTNSDYTSDSQTGFNVGVIRAFSISKQMPLYLQSGLAFEMKGAENSFTIEGERFKNTFKSYALEVPLLLNYGISISNKSTLHPFIGLYYAFALCGDLDDGGESSDPFKKRDVIFGDEVKDTRLFNRSDFGVRMGIDYKYSNISIGVAYDAGLMNIYAKEYRDRNYEASTGSFSINLGYYFK